MKYIAIEKNLVSFFYISLFSGLVYFKLFLNNNLDDIS